MSQEQLSKEFGDRRKNPAYSNGWGDGCFGPTQLFFENSNLAEWAGPQERLSYNGGIVTVGGTARCWRTGTLPDTGLRFSFRRYSLECVEKRFMLGSPDAGFSKNLSPGTARTCARTLELDLRPQNVGVLNRNGSRWIVSSSYYSFEAHLTGTVITQ